MKKLDFNQNWTVQKDGDDVVRTVNLPHDAMLYENRRKDSPCAGASGYFEPGRYLYKKLFAAPASWQEKKVILECEAVYQNACLFHIVICTPLLQHFLALLLLFALLATDDGLNLVTGFGSGHKIQPFRLHAG